MQKNNFFDIVEKNIQKGGEVSPFLFEWTNLELLHGEITHSIQALFTEYWLDAQSLFHLVDTWESLKIDEVKRFISQWDIKPRFAFQVFFLENISRMTHQAANACLKFFEEPGVGNIIILTNQWDSWILDTILSRVQTISVQSAPVKDSTSFYCWMIDSHVLWTSDELVRYFFSWKYEKWEYAIFLKSIVDYIAKTGKFLDLLDELHEDIWGVLKNNLQGKYVVDKYIMLLR